MHKSRNGAVSGKLKRHANGGREERRHTEGKRTKDRRDQTDNQSPRPSANEAAEQAAAALENTDMIICGVSSFGVDWFAENVLPLLPEESVTALVVTREFHENEYLMMVTRKGTVKRIPFIALKTNRKGGIRAITLNEGDHLINVIRTEGDDNILLATAQGMAICFNENDVRPMGRDAAGVRGILLTGDDFVVGAEKAEEGKTLLTVTVNGFGKRTELTEYLRTGPNGEKIAQGRGGKGLKNYNITPKTGPVAGCRVVGEDDDVMLIENGGVIIRVPASDINIYKRDVQGVIVMRIEPGNQLVAIERIAKVEEPQK